ncbi:hypothetical protein CEXT_22101 [Caerostris extrusa]|uniref:Uncharacterized protein n=1 Tax=Caerostris extrusa TaxID=172846 RepID=A0AAV4YAM6_CAEEX|nr:hypothetical protein CEXT_22101 [Caerostris extrusa]
MESHDSSALSQWTMKSYYEWKGNSRWWKSEPGASLCSRKYDIHQMPSLSIPITHRAEHSEMIYPAKEQKEE